MDVDKFRFINFVQLLRLARCRAQLTHIELKLLRLARLKRALYGRNDADVEKPFLTIGFGMFVSLDAVGKVFSAHHQTDR